MFQIENLNCVALGNVVFSSGSLCVLATVLEAVSGALAG